MNLNLKALTDAEVNRQLDELDDAARSLSDGNLFKAQILGMRDELWAELARRDEANRAKEDAELERRQRCSMTPAERAAVDAAALLRIRLEADPSAADTDRVLSLMRKLEDAMRARDVDAAFRAGRNL